jgi:hypothetical protein
VLAAIAVDIADVLEVLDPFVEAQKIEVGRRNEIDRVFVAVEETPDLRDIPKRSWHGDLLLSFGGGFDFFGAQQS